MNTNKALIETFYSAFQKQDYQTMASCYHPDAYFRDEAFELNGQQVPAMWHMLCERSSGLELSFHVNDEQGNISAHWEARYTFSQTGRPVHNIIEAQFEFKDGKIIKHIDSFNFWRWSRQALGLPGLLLGWSSFLRNKVSTMATKGLDGFMCKNSKYS